MCDYSLHSIQTRLALEGEELVVHRFATGTLGLTAPSAPHEGGCLNVPQTGTQVAVCIPPGAKLMLHNIPDHLQQRFEIGAVEEVTFTQLSADEYRHRDAVRFRNGREVLLQLLSAGQRVKVLCLSVDAPDHMEQKEFAPILVATRGSA